MPPPDINGLLETSLYVTDLQRALDFYQAVFRFPSLYSDHRLCALDVGPRQVLLLFLKGGSSEAAHTAGGVLPAHDGSGHLHLAFAIAPENLARWERWLGDCGIELESSVRWPAGGSSLYFRDPDGHLVEVATPGLWKNY